MGYTTDFSGDVAVVPPLNEAECAYLTKFAETRHMTRTKGPYYLGGPRDEADVTDGNTPAPGQPELWCNWVPTEDGAAIEWSGAEKFYGATEWMRYLINHFLKPGAVASTSGDKQFAGFTFDHVVNGAIDAYGEDPNDRWRLRVKDNDVTRQEPTITWADE